jgi:methylamine utilization protein MauE
LESLVLFTRGTLLIVFAAAVLGKAHSRAAWSSFVAATGSLLHVRRGQVALASATVAIEIGTVVCLSLNRTANVGMILSLVVLTAFLSIVVSGVNRGIRTACNCFGSDGNVLGRRHIWRNVTLVSVAAVGTSAAITAGMPPAFGQASDATPLVLSLIVAALFAMWDDFIDLVLGPPRLTTRRPARRGG